MSLLGGGGGGSKARVTMSFYMTFFYFEGVPNFKKMKNYALFKIELYSPVFCGTTRPLIGQAVNTIIPVIRISSFRGAA